MLVDVDVVVVPVPVVVVVLVVVGAAVVVVGHGHAVEVVVLVLDVLGAGVVDDVVPHVSETLVQVWVATDHVKRHCPVHGGAAGCGYDGGMFGLNVVVVLVVVVVLNSGRSQTQCPVLSWYTCR